MIRSEVLGLFTGAASMRPRPKSRGNLLPAVRADDRDLAASMRPRPKSRGNAGLPGETAEDWDASMRPRPKSRGNA